MRNPLSVLRKALSDWLSPVSERGGWWSVVRESYAGAWQQNIEVMNDVVLAYHAIFSCITLISNDIGKLRPKLVEQDADGIWSETVSSAFSPVLRKPNHFQNRIQFIENWMCSKLSRGNAYGLKRRDSRGVVVHIYLLDPNRVRPLVSPAGDVFYQIDEDNLSGIEETQVTVPADEIIHDRMNCLFHPLVGLSPIYAAGLAATQGLSIQKNSTRFFTNMSRPSGILTAPGAISNETAARLKEQWESNYTGENFGKVAVLGDNLKYEKISVTAEESQLIEQLKWTAEIVCSCFHVPPFKIGLGQMPTYQNAEVLNQIYYSDCLQSLIEQFELCMDEGLGLSDPKEGRLLGVELDLDGLLRMDTSTQIKSLAEAVGGTLLTPNEARRKLDRKPLKGGDTVYMQQQNFSIEALADRDNEKPFSKPNSPAPVVPQEADDDISEEDIERAFAVEIAKSSLSWMNLAR